MNLQAINFLTRKGHLNLCTAYSEARETQLVFLVPTTFERHFIEELASGRHGVDDDLIDFLDENELFPMAEGILSGNAIELLDQKVARWHITLEDVESGSLAKHVGDLYQRLDRLITQAIEDNVAGDITILLEQDDFGLNFDLH